MASRAVDTINTGPSFTQADADALNARFAGIDVGPMLRQLFAEGMLGRVAVVSSFGTEAGDDRHSSGYPFAQHRFEIEPRRVDAFRIDVVAAVEQIVQQLQARM